MNEIEKSVMNLSAQGKNCAEIIMTLSLDMRGIDNELLIKSMAGLGGGQFRQKDCGTLTSCCCAIAGYFVEEEILPNHVKEIIVSFGNWFEEMFSSSQCHTILENAGQDMCFFCPMLMTKSFEKMVTLLEEYDIDPYG